MSAFLLPIYDESTIITYGKYKFKQIKHIPSQYLLDRAKDLRDPSLMEYVSANQELLKERAKTKTPVIEMCEKIPLDEGSALKMLKDIAKVEQEHKKPVRAYLCPKCQLWHLTSKEFFN